MAHMTETEILGLAGIPIFDKAEDFYIQLCAGGMADQFELINLGYAGNRAADLALRRYAADFIDRGRFAELSTQIRAYVVRVLTEPFLHPVL